MAVLRQPVDQYGRAAGPEPLTPQEFNAISRSVLVDDDTRISFGGTLTATHLPRMQFEDQQVGGKAASLLKGTAKHHQAVIVQPGAWHQDLVPASGDEASLSEKAQAETELLTRGQYQKLSHGAGWITPKYETRRTPENPLLPTGRQLSSKVIRGRWHRE